MTFRLDEFHIDINILINSRLNHHRIRHYDPAGWATQMEGPKANYQIPGYAYVIKVQMLWAFGSFVLPPTIRVLSYVATSATNLIRVSREPYKFFLAFFFLLFAYFSIYLQTTYVLTF